MFTHANPHLVEKDPVPEQQKPLWTCPKCGHRFVTANMWHSCGRYRLSDHFKNKDPVVRTLWRRFRSLVEDCGPMTVYAQKTRIVCQARVRFAGAMPKKHWLDVGLWLKRRAEHLRVHRVEFIPPGDYSHIFRFHDVSEFDDAFVALIHEAYEIGCQHHLDR